MIDTFEYNYQQYFSWFSEVILAPYEADQLQLLDKQKIQTLSRSASEIATRILKTQANLLGKKSFKPTFIYRLEITKILIWLCLKFLN